MKIRKNIFASQESDLLENVNDISENIEDIQEQLDDFEEDEINIPVDNNISNHYIAQCDKCKGIFISAVAKSEQDLEAITGKCPLCQKESKQYLNWIVKSIEGDSE